MPLTGQWVRLDKALRPLGFSSFDADNIGPNTFAGLNRLTASSVPAVRQVVEQVEWTPLARQLGSLNRRAQFIAIKSSGEHVDLVIGKEPIKDLHGKPWAQVEEEYIEVIDEVLRSLKNATMAYKLEGGVASQITNELGKIKPTDITQTTALEVLKFLVPFLRWRGNIRCLVITSSSKPGANHIASWKGQKPVRFSSTVSVQGWLWDTHSDNVYGNIIFDLHNIEIPELSSTEQLERYFRHLV